MTHTLIAVHLVTLLFRLSTTLIVPLLPGVVLRSILLFSNFRSIFFAAPGLTITGMIIGSSPGMFIVIVSFPALKFGYNAIVSLPSLTMKLFAGLNNVCFFVLLFFVIKFSFTVHGANNFSLLVMFATVSNLFPFLSWIVITRLGIFSGLICPSPSVSLYWISASSFGKSKDICPGIFCGAVLV